MSFLGYFATVENDPAMGFAMGRSWEIRQSAEETAKMPVAMLRRGTP